VGGEAGRVYTIVCPTGEVLIDEDEEGEGEGVESGGSGQQELVANASTGQRAGRSSADQPLGATSLYFWNCIAHVARRVMEFREVQFF